MSATISSAPTTVKQRGIDATKRLRELLGLDDLNLLAIALAETAADEIGRNTSFSERVRHSYQELAQIKSKPKASKARTSRPATKLVPIAHIDDAVVDPYAPPDPNFLLRLYGPAQLRAALEDYTLDKLKEAAVSIQQKYPGTKPKSKASKAAVIDYIVEHVAKSSS